MASSLFSAIRKQVQQVRRASFMAIKLTDSSQRIINLDSFDGLEIKGRRIMFYKNTGRLLDDSRYFVINYETQNLAEAQFKTIKTFLIENGKLIDVDNKKV